MAAGATVVLAVILTMAAMSPASAASSADDSAFTYGGTWTAATGEHWTKTAGATATATVTVATGGGTITVTGKNADAGYVGLVIDSATSVYVDAYSTNSASHTLFTTPALHAGTHTVKLTVANLKNASSPGIGVSLTGISTSNGDVVLPTPPSSTPPPSTPPSSSSPPPPAIAPNGPSGSWKVAFDDEFNGTALNTSNWSPNWYGEGGTMNGVPTYARNVSVHDGAAWLQLEGSGSTPSAGAAIETDHSGGARLAVGQYAEARVYLPGPSSTALSNWGGWWTTSTSADGWASSGEHDIEETLSGQATNNYHYGVYPNVTADNHGGVSGFTPGNSWHTYGILRAADHADIYWDGVKVKSYTTHDNGKPEILVFNVGNGSNDAYGAAGAERVDYARVFSPA